MKDNLCITVSVTEDDERERAWIEVLAGTCVVDVRAPLRWCR